MRKRIPTNTIRIGMYVDGFDTSWFKTPFLRHHFGIKSQNQLDKILESGIDHVYIDTDKGLDDLSDEQQAPPQADVNKVPCLPAKDVAPDDSVFTNYVRAINDLILIDKLCLIEATAVGFDLFTKTDMDIVPLSVARNSKGELVITKELLASPCELMIDRSEIQRYRDYLAKIAKDSGVAHGHGSKNMIIKETARLLVRDLFNDPGNHEKVEACKDTVETIISSIVDTKGLITNLFTVNKHDYYVYTHSVNVSVFCVATALAMGIQSRAELFAIGLGSLLHDIGMSTLPPEVLYKPVQYLTEFEAELLRGHIFEGLDIVNLYKGIPPEAMPPLIEHHENLIGTGYPMGIKGDKLHVSGKIISITNTYDTLTTSRPGFKAISPYEALAYLRDQNSLYDADILKEFITVLGKSSQ
ncbi:MAG: DUF3391 domain-containing protein [Nitrospirae bacterium]|nr:DUF3391 domain-containing protein [Nitrospirota bacterium]